MAIPVLVLGDWVLDENWVLAHHQSPLSSLEGKAHLRALGKLDSRVMTFCGAGRVARFLYWLNRFTDTPLGDAASEVSWQSRDERMGRFWFDVVGLGVWAAQDEGRLYKMFHPAYPSGLNSFTLTKASGFSPYNELDGLILSSLADACPAGEEIGTTRIYRLYQHRAEALGGLELDRRIDFELRFSKLEAAPVRSFSVDRLAKILSDVKKRASTKQGITADIKTIFENIENSLSEIADRTRLLPLDTRTRELLALLEKAHELATVPKDAPAKSMILSKGQPFRYAIIKELGKGSVTKELLQALAKAKLVSSETTWFISSKLIQPTWLVDWEPSWGKVYLWFLAPKAVAPRLLQDTQSGNVKLPPPFPNKWFVGGQHPAREAIRGLDELRDIYFSKQEEAFIVAMPRGLSLLGVEQKGSHCCGYCYPDPVLSKLQAELTGRASIFFAALAAEVIHRKEMDHRKAKWSLIEPLQVALAAAEHYVDAEINHFLMYGEAEQQGSHPLLIGPDSSLENYRLKSSTWKVRHFDWKRASKEWDEAHTGTGVVVRDNAHYLDIWRARYELEDFIETVSEKRREIGRLIRALKDFNQALLNPLSLSALLIAKPGSGKSYLVSRLAESLEMTLLKFNVTQMVTRANVIACFDVIASAQAKARGSRHLVFFDEINSLLEGSHVYDLFLSVLEDSTYLRQGQHFKLEPCAWLFASTEPLMSSQEARSTIDDSEALAEYLSTKAPDFHSRLNLKAVKLDREGLEQESRLGFVYQGAIQLQNKHPDIKLISPEVLCAFYCLPIGTSVREIRHYAEQFRNVQYGEVRKRNMPDVLVEVLSHAPRDEVSIWEHTFGVADLDRPLVRIRRQPSDIADKCSVHEDV